MIRTGNVVPEYCASLGYFSFPEIAPQAAITIVPTLSGYSYKPGSDFFATRGWVPPANTTSFALGTQEIKVSDINTNSGCWFPTITTGSFYLISTVGDVAGQTYVDLSDFTDDELVIWCYSTTPCLRDASQTNIAYTTSSNVKTYTEQATIKNINTLQVSHTPVYSVGTLELLGSSQTDTNLTLLDSWEGTIQTTLHLSTTTPALVTYMVLEDSFSYTGYREGQSFNFLDLAPFPTHISEWNATPFASSTFIDTLGVQLLLHPVWAYGIHTNSDTPVALTFDGEAYNKTAIENQAVITWTPLTENVEAVFPDLTLAKLYVRDPVCAGNIAFYDLRQRGGGLNPDFKGRITNGDMVADITNGDGIALPLVGTVLASIPESVITAHGEEEVRDAIKASIPAGVGVAIHTILEEA